MSHQPTSDGPKLEFDVHFRPGRQGRRELADGPAAEATPRREGLPRVTRLLALAHRWNDLLERGEVRNQAEIARLMGITQARVTQIMNLLLLNPALQEEWLLDDSSPPSELVVRSALRSPIWNKQLGS